MKCIPGITATILLSAIVWAGVVNPAARGADSPRRYPSSAARTRDAGAKTGTAKAHASGKDSGLPRVFLVDPKTLVETKGRVAAGDKDLAPSASRLKRDADKSLKLGPFSVTNCPMAPPSGDKHDYISLGRYWWPNPDTPNGLPYVRRDGQTNPEIEKYGSGILSGMTHAVDTLALAYYLSGEEAYAQRAALLLRTFFLDAATRMNPHMEYSQFIPGKNTGRSAGMVDSAELPHLLDSIGMLAGSRAWTAADQKGMEAWFRRFLDWSLQSKIGQGEAAAKNNHGTWYDVQVVTYALFVGDTATAKKMLRDVPQRRIDAQIQPDGSQPLELARTKSFDYCVFNLRAMFDLATLGQHEGVDLWTYASRDGRGIRRALDYMAPYIRGEKTWEHEQIKKLDPDTLFPMLRRAANAYREPSYEELIDKLPPKDFGIDRVNLLYPKAR